MEILPCLLLASLSFLWFRKLYLRATALLSDHPGDCSFFDKTTIKPRIFGFSREKTVTWLQKYQVFEKFGWDIIPAVSFFPRPAVSYFVADPIAIKEIGLTRWKFPKHPKEYQVFDTFGPNILSAEGTEWKKFRKILSPSYSERTNILVWEQSCKIMERKIETWGQCYNFDDIVQLTFVTALEVASICLFGVPFDNRIFPGHQMSFSESLRVVVTDGFLKIALPSWIMRIFPRFRKIDNAFKELWQYMHEFIAAYNSGNSMNLQPHSLFNNLLDSNRDVVGGLNVLEEKEIFGNMFITFFAGHETSAHTLAFALILLAKHPDIQEDLHLHIKNIMKDDPVPKYSDISRYTYTLAAINETLRMYPIVTGFSKYSTHDTVLSSASSESSETRKSVPILKGSKVLIDVPALHYNKKYWPNPHKYDPSRFLRDYNKDAFIPFNVGSRACLGRSFFESEAIAVLNMIVVNYRIELPAHLRGSSDSTVEIVPGMTLQPASFPLQLRRRD